MIDFLTAWVKMIVFVVLFATFLEFLLPNSSMQRFVKLILGLFIMLTVLNPIVNLLHHDWATQNVTTIAQNSPDSAAIIQAKQNLVKERERLTLEVYKSDIAKQAKALITAIDGVSDAKVVVSLSDKTDGKSIVKKISKLEVYVQPGFTKMKDKINEIKIKEPPANSNQDVQPELIGKIKKTLCEFYQLRYEDIDISRL